MVGLETRPTLQDSIDRFDEPQAASVFRKKRTPTKTGKRQRMGMARLVVTSTRLAMAVHRDGCPSGILAGRLQGTTFCPESEDMPTQSRPPQADGTRRRPPRAESRSGLPAGPQIAVAKTSINGFPRRRCPPSNRGNPAARSASSSPKIKDSFQRGKFSDTRTAFPRCR
jgi:hypothetical protein